MISKKIGLFNHGDGLVKENPNTGRLSNIIDTMIRCAQARLNLLRGLSEIEEQFGSNENFQQVDINDKKSGTT